MSNGPVHASDCACCQCGAQAVTFWPAFDPDIEAHPYCRACLDRAKHELLIKLHEAGLFAPVDRP